MTYKLGIIKYLLTGMILQVGLMNVIVIPWSTPQAGDCFDLSIALASLLIGVGFLADSMHQMMLDANGDTVEKGMMHAWNQWRSFLSFCQSHFWVGWQHILCILFWQMEPSIVRWWWWWCWCWWCWCWWSPWPWTMHPASKPEEASLQTRLWCLLREWFCAQIYHHQRLVCTVGRCLTLKVQNVFRAHMTVRLF